MKRLCSVLLVFALAISLVAAGCSSPAPDASGDTEAASDASEDAAAAPEASDETAAASGDETAAGGEIKMAWYFPMPFPYGDTVQEGVKKFEADTGIAVTQQVGPDMEQSSQNERVEALAAQGVNALSIYPSDPSGANALYEELTARGMKIVNFGTSTTEPTTASFAVATDVKQAAYDACEYLIEQMGGKGSILNVLEVISDPNTILRREGIEECVANYPDVSIVQEISDINSSEEAVVKIESGFSANASKIDGIICTGYATTVGLTTVLENYYDQGGDRVLAIGMDTDPLVIESITDGILNATMAQNPLGHGYISCMLLKLMVVDGYTPVEGKYFVDSGCAIVTKDNLETYEEDVEKVTQTILDSLTTEYLTK
jgi:ribose transport system substrate-binding protein